MMSHPLAPGHAILPVCDVTIVTDKTQQVKGLYTLLSFAQTWVQKLIVHFLMWLPEDIILYTAESLILLVAVAMAR